MRGVRRSSVLPSADEMLVTGQGQEEPVGPGWVARHISEIKPGGFQAMRSMEAEFDSLRKEDVRQRATTDPMYRYIKRLLPAPR